MVDTGDFTADLAELVVALGEAAQEHGQVLVFLIEEIQYLRTGELSALVMAQASGQPARAAVVFAGAGLPQLPALTGQAPTCAERVPAGPRVSPAPKRLVAWSTRAGPGLLLPAGRALPERELDYLRALASLGPGEHTPADVARAMRVESSASIGSFFRRLTERGVIHNSKRGRVAFTVPQFDRCVTRSL